jgi:hypothetical protein
MGDWAVRQPTFLKKEAWKAQLHQLNTNSALLIASSFGDGALQTAVRLGRQLANRRAGGPGAKPGAKLCCALWMHMHPPKIQKTVIRVKFPPYMHHPNFVPMHPQETCTPLYFALASPLGEAMLCTVDAYAPPKNPKNSDKSQISTIYASPKFCSYAPTRDVHPLIFCSSFATAADHQTRRPPPQMRASRRP